MDGVEWMDGYPLDCYDYQSTCGANNMLANPIVTFLTTDIPQAWVQVNPFFGVTADYHIYSFFSQLFFFWLFLHNVFGAFFSQFIVSAPFFTIGLFGLDQSAPASFTVVRTTSKKSPSHDNALCTLCLWFHGKSLSGLLLLRIRQHILYLYFV